MQTSNINCCVCTFGCCLGSRDKLSNTFQFKRQVDTYSYIHMYFLTGILQVSFLFRVTLSLQTSTRLLQSGFLKQDITTMRSVATASLDTSASII